MTSQAEGTIASSVALRAGGEASASRVALIAASSLCLSVRPGSRRPAAAVRLGVAGTPRIELGSGVRREQTPRRQRLLSRLLLATQPQRGGVVSHCEPSERERGQQQSEVAQRDVVVARVGEQVDDDPGKPSRDQECAEAWL